MAFISFLITGLLLITPFTALAIDTVGGVTLTQSGSDIVVGWGATPGAVSYNVYLSHQSILQNSGDYDDVTNSPGTVTRMILDPSLLPTGVPQLFVSVLAVDALGNESDGFETEASLLVSRTVVPSSSASSFSSQGIENVSISSSASSSQLIVNNVPQFTPSLSSSSSSSTPSQFIPTPPPLALTPPMTIRALRPTSGTGILILFTKPLLASYEPRVDAFTIRTASGVSLPVNRIEKPDTQSLLFITEPQTSGATYILTFGENIPGIDGTAFPFTSPPAQFIGYEIVEPIIKKEEDVAPPPPLPIIRSITLTPVVAHGKPIVRVEWESEGIADSFRVLLSINGHSFEEVSIVDGETHSVDLTGIRSGSDVSVKVLAVQGTRVSIPSLQSIHLPLAKTGSSLSLMIALSLGFVTYIFHRRYMTIHSV